MLVTVGATEAIASAILGLVEPGSEVLLIEPFFDSYSPVVAMAGCQRRAVPLVQDGRGFADRCRGAPESGLTPKTKALIVNSPHNPTGMVASDDELKALARLAVDADLLVIADEVYEHLVFDGHRHIPLANYPGMAGRTVTISSAAKMFNCTGWKIGWACGAADLISGVRAAKQYLSYVGGAPFQPAVAHALNTEEAWVATLRESLQAKRDKLGSALADLGFEVHDSFGTYFLCADPRPLGYHDSTAFCAQLPDAPAWRRSRCPHSAIRVPTTPTRGITWCASPSASVTRRSTRRSAGCRCCETSRRPRGNSHRRRRCRPPRV